jgi:adenine deaminase
MNKGLIQVSLGESQADLYLEGGKVINVFSGEIYETNVAVFRDKIAYVGLEKNMVGPETKVLSAKNFYLAPGYIEPHAHPWAIYNPLSLMEETLPLGTTVTVCDNLFFFLQLGKEGFLKLIKETNNWPLRYFWSARVFPQSPLAGEEEIFSLENIQELLAQREVLAIAEITRWPDLLTNQGHVWEKIHHALTLGKKVEGHTAGASYDKLNALVASGLHCCHEAITPEQVQDQLRLGLWVMLRHSSLRPDLPQLIQAISAKNLDHRRMMLTSDGPTPYFAHQQGWLPGMLNFLVKNGIDPVKALQMATINPATFYGIDHLYGGIAPGRRADILFLSSLDQFMPVKVIANGTLVADKGKWLPPLPKIDWHSFGFKHNFASGLKVDNPSLYTLPLEGTKNEIFPVIELLNAVITRRKDVPISVKNGQIDLTPTPDLLTICLVDKEGKWITKGLIKGFATHIEGLAATFSTSTHLVVIGNNPRAMAKAAQQVVDWDGGIVLVEQDELVCGIPLPLGGMMSTLPLADLLPLVKEIEEEVSARGYHFNDLLYSLLFFSCDFLPDFRLTSRGLFQVKTGSIVVASEPIS